MLHEPTSLFAVLMIVLIGMGLVFTLLILLIGCTVGLSFVICRLDFESGFTSVQDPPQTHLHSIAAAAGATAHHRRLIHAHSSSR